MRDSQRSRVYAWEDIVLKDYKEVIPFDRAQMFVDSVWLMEGLMHPPKIEELPKQAKTICADATRLTIRINRDGILKQVLLHEISHSMTADIEGNSEKHGENFVGVYAKLLVKYLKVSLPIILFTTKKYGVAMNIAAMPTVK